jgi:VIT1/CCC1 family predicted Fe2+/Mn2+ transporter
MRLRDRTSLAIPSHLGVALESSVAIDIPLALLPVPCLTQLDALTTETIGYLDIYAIAPAPHVRRTSLATSETMVYLDSDGAAPVPLDVSRILLAAPRIIVNIGFFTIGAVVPVLATVDPADDGPAAAASLVTLPVACFHQLDAFDYIEIVDYFDLDEAAPPPPDVSRILQAAPCITATIGYYTTGAAVPVLPAVDPADAVPHRTLPAVAALPPRAPHEFYETKGQSSLYAACPPTDRLSAAY